MSPACFARAASSRLDRQFSQEGSTPFLLGQFPCGLTDIAVAIWFDHKGTPLGDCQHSLAILLPDCNIEFVPDTFSMKYAVPRASGSASI